MNFNIDFDIELTLLSEEEIFGKNQLDVLRKYGTQSAITDLAILTGGICSKKCYVPDDTSLKGRTVPYYTKSSFYENDLCIDLAGNMMFRHRCSRSEGIRPIIKNSTIFDSLYPNRIKGYNGCEVVEFGEYPQYAPISDVQELLEKKYQVIDLRKTGKKYTFDSTAYSNFSQSFRPVTYEEYEYNEKKYIRVEARSCCQDFQLSNYEEYKNGDNVWVEVSPVVWLIDEETKSLVCKRGILSGILFHTGSKKYNGDFKTTEMKKYLDKHMSKELFQNITLEEYQKPEEQEIKAKKRINPYGLKFNNVSEEDIIKGSIESGVPVFLHGPSSEGKSARVKQLDPDCTIIYLRNSTPDSLNGKSVYHSKTGEMIDVKPTWLKKLEAKCENEPEKLHIVFFDELTNALPSIQGIAFNIILDKEVNGIWKLPENARIVAAGNEMKDSLSANQLSEPLFNRFAHVYIKTTTESWLQWASEHHIHPAIYSYIAYKKGKTLRSKYDGEKPNADPRKWEMASKMLYATGQPEMLRALVGEEITKDFVEFCKQEVITLKDVLQDNYSKEDIQRLNTASKYATAVTLSQVDEENMAKVRQFITNLGAEFVAIFDSLWNQENESRLEQVLEQRLTNSVEKRILQKNVELKI